MNIEQGFFEVWSNPPLLMKWRSFDVLTSLFLIQCSKEPGSPPLTGRASPACNVIRWRVTTCTLFVRELR